MSWARPPIVNSAGLVGALLTLVFIVGCAEPAVPRGRVHGKVTVDGKPLPEGQIRFFALSGGIGTDGAVKDGTYDIPVESGMSAGKYRVEVSSIRTTGRKVPDYDGAEGAMKDEVVEDLPAKFNQKSTLQIDFSPDKNEPHDFDLKR